MLAANNTIISERIIPPLPIITTSTHFRTLQVSDLHHHTPPTTSAPPLPIHLLSLPLPLFRTLTIIAQPRLLRVPIIRTTARARPLRALSARATVLMALELADRAAASADAGYGCYAHGALVAAADGSLRGSCIYVSMVGSMWLLARKES